MALEYSKAELAIQGLFREFLVILLSSGATATVQLIVQLSISAVFILHTDSQQL